MLNTVGQLVSCSMAAFAFAALPFRFRGPLFALLLVTLIIPFQVVLVPNFILYRLPAPPVQRERQLDRDAGAAVGRRVARAARSGRSCCASSSSRSRGSSADAARVDGANPWQIYRHIYLPLARPALATLAIFTFMWTWNDLINPIIYLRDVDSHST